MPEQRFEVWAFYNSNPGGLKTPGGLALHLWHANEHTMLMDAEIFIARKDIAHITVRDNVHSRTKDMIADSYTLKNWLEETKTNERRLRHPLG